MLKRLRSAHPMLYCLGAEVLFLGMLFVASMVSLLGILFVLRDLEMADDYLLTTLQEAAGILTACSAAGAAASSTACWWACTPSHSSATTPTTPCCLAARRAICCPHGASCGSCWA